MIKALRGEEIILGLSDHNMERLPSAPIKFNMKKDLNLDDIDMYLVCGDRPTGRVRNNVIIHLTAEDMSNLKAGHGIKFNLSDIGISQAVIIFNGRTEESMYVSMMDDISLEHTILK